ncbi:MAG: helix-turn-helix domain-containing protein, partial [Anaerolineae bacterium]|nr:helix-turn-helix domain-containing protein [Anaerolineae bacterium]
TLRAAIKSEKRVSVVKRATALCLLQEGKTPDEVATLLSVTAASIHNWRKRWEQAHLEGLSHRPISGRPSKATEAYWQSLEETLEQNPRSLGYRFSIWTTERLSQHLTEKTGIRLSAERLRVLMRERGYVYRRPKADL